MTADRDAVHWVDPGAGPSGTTCREAPPVEYEAMWGGDRISWAPVITTVPSSVTCKRCADRLTHTPIPRDSPAPYEIARHPDCGFCVINDAAHGQAMPDKDCPVHGDLGIDLPQVKQPRARGGIIRPGQQIYISGQDGPITPLRPALPHTKPDQLPIDHIVVNSDLVLSGEQFEMGSLQHDVNTGTVTIKLVDVKHLTIVYKHMLEEGS